MPRTDKQFHIMAQARALSGSRGEVMIYSAIGSWKWGEDDPTVTSNDFDKQLKALGEVDEITVRINSPGGVVSEAIAIRTALMKHPAKKTIDIEGCCDSAATLIACLPGARVRMAQGGEYMIHRCSFGAWGHADDLLSAYNSAKQTDSDMAGIYADRTGMTQEECLALMEAETWYGAEAAKAAGFVDEIIQGAEDEQEIAACAVDAETLRLMRACYAHVPDREIRTVSNETQAVAAEVSTENTETGVDDMELKDATAELLRKENPALVQQIAQEAVEAERARVSEINALTRPGEKWEAMAKKAIDEGTSSADFLKAVISEEKKAGREYLEARQRELAPAAQVGGGDSGDHDKDSEKSADQAAKEIALLAKEMGTGSPEMA